MFNTAAYYADCGLVGGAASSELRLLPLLFLLIAPSRMTCGGRRGPLFFFGNSLNRATTLYFMLALNIPARRTLVTAYSRADLSRALSARLTTQRRGSRGRTLMPEAQDKAHNQYKSAVYTLNRSVLTSIPPAAIHHNVLSN